MRYWKRLKPDGSIRTVESYSHDLKIKGAIEITKKEFNDYLSSLPEPPPEVSRDLATEVDAIYLRLDKLERRAK